MVSLVIFATPTTCRLQVRSLKIERGMQDHEVISNIRHSKKWRCILQLYQGEKKILNLIRGVTTCEDGGCQYRMKITCRKTYFVQTFWKVADIDVFYVYPGLKLVV